MTGRVGRPLGYTPKNKGTTLTHQQGAWAWNSPRLHAKIETGKKNECWSWLGSAGPSGNLYGAYKNGKPQMTQPNRLIYMEMTDSPAEDVAIYMRCHNRNCCNHNHFEILPNKVKGYKHAE